MMAKRKKEPTPTRKWQPLQPAVSKNPALFHEVYPEGTQMWMNDLYVVHCVPMPGADDEGNRVMGHHLSIRRVDRKPIRDWRHFQRIKNEICGPEREALEIYPAESRLVDEANQYHLYVLPEGQVIPFGSNEGRVVSGADEAAVVGARQRPLDQEALR